MAYTPFQKYETLVGRSQEKKRNESGPALAPQLSEGHARRTETCRAGRLSVPSGFGAKISKSNYPPSSRGKMPH